MNELVDQKFPEWLTFLGQWLRNPKSMASLLPSGRQLGRLMAAALPSNARLVAELGAGTGAITDALLKHGVQGGSLLVIETSHVLSEHLGRRFPDTRVVCGDARSLVAIVDVITGFRRGHIDAVVSSLGLLSMSPELQREIYTAAFAVMRPSGVLVQYTYGPKPPLDERVRNAMGLRVSRGGWAWRNFPPARVYVYSREHSG